MSPTVPILLPRKTLSTNLSSYARNCVRRSQKPLGILIHRLPRHCNTRPKLCLKLISNQKNYPLCSGRVGQQLAAGQSDKQSLARRPIVNGAWKLSSNIWLRQKRANLTQRARNWIQMTISLNKVVALLADRSREEPLRHVLT